MSQRIQKGSVPFEILMGILQLFDDFIALYQHRGSMRYSKGNRDTVYAILSQKRKQLALMDKRRFKHELARLEQQGYINLVRKGEEVYLSLTKVGVQEAFRRLIREKKKRLPKNIRCSYNNSVPFLVRCLMGERRTRCWDSDMSESPSL